MQHCDMPHVGIFVRYISCPGLFMNGGYVLNEWRIPGVLWRFGMSYASSNSRNDLAPVIPSNSLVVYFQ